MPDRVRVHVRTLGCKVNRVESEAIAAELLGSGAELSPEQSANVIVVNTCTVTGEADAKARKAVRQALAAASRPLVVVTGCLAAIDSTMLQLLGDRVLVEPDKEQVASLVCERLGLDRGVPVVRSGEGFRTRAMLKVQDGCDAFCSYCIVPYARGVPRSVPADHLVQEARGLVAAGVKEIVLTGVNLGRYSGPDHGLADLVRKIADTGVARLRLSSIEPLHIGGSLLAALAETPAVCPHLHVPLQSGSDAVLRSMRREYTLGEYESRISALREAVPALAVTTDVISGFPGETDEDASVTLEACERIGFAKLHVFRYSERAGTPAAEMPGRVPPVLRAERASALRALGDRLRSAYISGKVPGEETLLVEKVSPRTAEGTTGDYATVRIENPPQGCRPGDVLVADIVSSRGEVLIGRAKTEVHRP